VYDIFEQKVVKTIDCIPIMENELLNEYFPELKNYEGAEDDMVTFILKGYPSKEEVAEMLK
ncbi:MAG: hypothetical protein ACI4TB_04160, partial [Lachnospiraceae bacterium]